MPKRTQASSVSMNSLLRISYLPFGGGPVGCATARPPNRPGTLRPRLGRPYHGESHESHGGSPGGRPRPRSAEPARATPI